VNNEQQAKLRQAFPKEAIGKLPKAGMQLDYVGHAAVTDRLLQVDPEWTWEPFSVDDQGLPAFDESGGLWIRLTIAGVTRPGYGHPERNQGPDRAKVAISDAIRNAAMRFGVALDLWAKEDLSHTTPENASADVVAQRMAEIEAAWSVEQLAEIGGRIAKLHLNSDDRDKLAAAYKFRKDELLAAEQYVEQKEAVDEQTEPDHV
jgi:hypothetical protein